MEEFECGFYQERNHCYLIVENSVVFSMDADDIDIKEIVDVDFLVGRFEEELRNNIAYCEFDLKNKIEKVKKALKKEILDSYGINTYKET